MNKVFFGKITILCIVALACRAELEAQSNTFPTSGNVGIGTTNPSAPLDLEGSGGVMLNIGGSGGALSFSGTGVSSPPAGLNYGLFPLSGIGLGLYSIAGGISFWGGSTPTPYMTILNGNAGIGTTTPQGKFHVLKSGNYFNYDHGADFIFNTGDGTQNNTYLRVLGGIYGGQNSTNIDLITAGNNYSAAVGWRIGSVNNGPANNYANPRDLAFYQLSSDSNGSVPNGVAAERMRITDAGNVGIGTTSPGAMLEVSGSVKLTYGTGASITFADGTTQSTAYTGTCTATGGDYAESMEVAGERSGYEPGDVMVLAKDSKFDVTKSSEPYSTMVAGIYSTKPGYVGRRQQTDPKLSSTEIPMAMVGVVPTKVSAENGPVHRGDLLVTASKSGYAMRGTNRRRMMGAVVGKAMGSLDSGTGVIDVLVSLQ